jgi:hypothetical protein
MSNYSSKDPSEIIFYGLNFGLLLSEGETITAATVACIAVLGTDAAAASMPTGSVGINGSVVRSLIGGGVHGVTYKVTFSVDTSSGQKLKDFGTFDVRKQ